MLVDEIDLNVADLATGAQVILAHQPVEVDRGGGAGVGLVIGHLGYGGQVIAEFVENRRRLFHRRARGHVDDDLELGLVVERQHLQLHESDGRQHE